MSTLMLSECERMALQASGQTTTSAFQIGYSQKYLTILIYYQKIFFQAIYTHITDFILMK